MINMQLFISLKSFQFYYASLGGAPLQAVKYAINAGYLNNR